jgi:N-acylneuraminate cytidylyltransferase
LKSKDLNKGLQKFNAEKFDSILSVVRQKRFLWSEIGSSQAAAAINYNPLARPRRQDFSGFFVENGAFYITSKERLLASECRISGKIGLVEMPEETYFEIDEPSDWLIVEQLLKKSVRVENDLTNKLEKIKCFLTDCDGVLTDSGMYYSENGEELKKFNTKDGMGLKILKENGIITGIITGESVDLVRRRAEKLGVDILYLGAKNKAKVLKEICANYNLTFEEIAYVGDDINDLEVIKEVGFGCTVHDGMDILRNSADYVTKAKGGHGAVRELVELIMGVRGNKNGF